MTIIKSLHSKDGVKNIIKDNCSQSKMPHLQKTGSSICLLGD